MPDFESTEWDDEIKRAINYVDELNSDPMPKDSAAAAAWKQLPEEVKRFAISANRYARLLGLDAPPAVLGHERSVLRPRIERLRVFLNALEKGLPDDD